ncbi:MAG: hypothetical protein AB7K24_13935, partial [Gemmataceae bacterium]
MPVVVAPLQGGEGGGCWRDEALLRQGGEHGLRADWRGETLLRQGGEHGLRADFEEEVAALRGQRLQPVGATHRLAGVRPPVGRVGYFVASKQLPAQVGDQPQPRRGVVQRAGHLL